ncbi:MAG: hypothetical protein ACOX2F_05785 [bacterium]
MSNFSKKKIKPLLLAFVCCHLAFSLTSGCGKTVIINKDLRKPAFYELCYNFPKLPENTEENDIKTALNEYEEHLNEAEITVLKRKNSSDSVCYFIDNFKEIPPFQKEIENNISQYLIHAYFNEEHSSVYGIFPGGKEAKKLKDNIPFLRKLPLYIDKHEGLVISGTNKKMLFMARYLDVLEIKNEFGFDEKGKMVINVKQEGSNRWKMVPFLFDLLDLGEFASPLPGDYALLSEKVNEKVSLKLNIPFWEKFEVPTAKEKVLGNEDALVFSVGTLSLPFDEETLLKYFYSLSKSYLLPPSNGLYYSPNFRGSNVSPTLLLLSSELAISGEYAVTPEMIYMWISSVASQLGSFPDSFYANLLSLKIAKKLYIGTPSFLGGAELVNMTREVPFENIAKMLFYKGNVTVFGSLESSLHLYQGDIISEFPTLTDLSKSARIKAVFGSPDESGRSIISFVVRSANAESLTENISSDLEKKGCFVIQTLFEQVSLNDAWGAVSVVVEKKDESMLLELYEKKFKLLNNTLSVGVYRVEKEK